MSHVFLESNHTNPDTIKPELHITRNNKKLKPNEKLTFIIFNLPRLLTCTFATLLCKLKCYVTYEERKCRPHVLPSRMENWELSKTPAFIPLLTDRIRSISDHCRKEQVIVRIHASGDFYDQAYTDKWLRIMDNLSDDHRILFVAYTKSFPFFDGITLPDNFALRASLWADTAPEQLAIVARNGWPTYTAVDAFHKGDHFTRCRCSDCATCKRCWQNYKDIRCLIHSGRQGTGKNSK